MGGSKTPRRVPQVTMYDEVVGGALVSENGTVGLGMARLGSGMGNGSTWVNCASPGGGAGGAARPDLPEVLSCHRIF